MARHLDKYRFAAVVAVLLIASNAWADPLPARKILLAPISYTDANYNFAALWNAIGGRIAADNAPALMAKSGADITGAGLRCLACGFVIGRNASTPGGLAGALVVDHDLAKITIASGAANIGKIEFSTTPLLPQWTLSRDIGNNFDIKGPTGNIIIARNPIVLYDEGRTYKTESYYLGTVLPTFAADRMVVIPIDASRAVPFAIRVLVVPDGVDAAADLDYRYQWVKSTTTVNVGGASIHTWADFVSADGVAYISEYSNLATLPTVEKFLILRFENNNTTVGYNHVTLEIRYVTLGVGWAVTD